MVEGVHHVGEVIEAGWHIEVLLYAPESLTSKFAQDLVSHFSGRMEQVSAQVMDSIADKENPQGIVAIVRQKNSHIADLADIRFGAALVSPQDPGNLGTILRTVDAVGGDCLFVLNGGVDPFHPTAIRASMGASLWKPVVETTVEEFDAWRQDRRCQLIGASAHADLDFRDFQPAHPWILLLGSEQKGLTPDQLRACDVVLRLPMRGRTSSLNLAVAAGILLYRLAYGRGS
jgi:TrmH family RNA methyltransferase